MSSDVAGVCHIFCGSRVTVFLSVLIHVDVVFWMSAFFGSNGCHGTWVGGQQFGSAFSVQIAVRKPQRITSGLCSTCSKMPFADLPKQAGALGRDDVRDCERVSEISKEVCKCAVRFVVGAGESAMLHSCSAGGNQIQVRAGRSSRAQDCA